MKQNDKSKWVAEKNGMTYFGLSDKGVIIKFYIIRKKTYFSYFVTYRISARRVMENDNFVGLFDTSDYSLLEDKVNMLIKSKSEYLPKLKKCNLRRMDFCVNARLENQEQVKAYIKIMKRANVPSKLELYEEYDKVSKRQKPTNIYTMYHEMFEKSDPETVDLLQLLKERETDEEKKK